MPAHLLQTACPELNRQRTVFILEKRLAGMKQERRGIASRSRLEPQHNIHRRFLPETEIATITSATADSYADIRLELKRLGTPIPKNDLWIAALARQHVLAVPSRDTHFDIVERIKRIGF